MNQLGVMKKGTSTDMTVSRGPVSDSVSLRYLQRLPAEQAADGAMQDREGEWLVWAFNFAIFGTWPRRHADVLDGRSYFCVATPSAVQTSWRSEVVRRAACGVKLRSTFEWYPPDVGRVDRRPSDERLRVSSQTMSSVYYMY